MNSLDNHANALWLQDFLNRRSYLRSHPLLDLQPLGIGVDNARQLGESYDPTVGNIGDPRLTDDGGEMVLAMAFEGYSTEDDHFLVAAGFVERLVQDRQRVLFVTSK